jgi:pimeloyl-ACP methyl ester carboxylesterase
MPKARINGIEINYRQVGEGEDVVFVHGLAANHAFWNLQLLLPLARLYRVTTYDLRGHGYSSMPGEGYTSARMVEDLIALLDRLDVDRAHLVGHSFGGVVATHCAVLHPGRVRSLTIQDTRLRALQPTQRLRDWPNWQEAQAALRTRGIDIDENAEEVGMILLEKLAAPEWRERRQEGAQQPLFIPFSGWSAGNRSAQRWLKLLNTTAARREIQEMSGLTRDAIASIAAPTLAIYGEHSRCLRTFEELGRVLPRARRLTMSRVGHFYPVIKPVAVAEMLLDFLGQIAPPSAVKPSELEQVAVEQGF